MIRFLLLISLLFSNIVEAQKIDGVYIGLELNGLEIDSSGQMYFYGLEFLPKEKWYNEVVITIKSGKITVAKGPVVFQDSVKTYSASDGGFVTYQGALTKIGDLYIVKAKMLSYHYKGFSIFEPSKILDDFDTVAVDHPSNSKSIKEHEEELKKTHDWIRDGNQFVFFQKGFLRQDYIVRPDKKGIWLNNVFFRRATKKDLEELEF